MQVRVLFFGVLKDLAGKASDSISLPENATLGDVLSHYEQSHPATERDGSRRSPCRSIRNTPDPPPG